MKVSPNGPCPCGSDRKLKKCCAQFHKGRPALPHQLMPARYTAYAIGNVDFIIRTTHPDGPEWREDPVAWKAELVAYCRSVRFTGLTVLESEMDESHGRAHVTFRAALERLDARGDHGEHISFTERSLFLQHDGRWRYHPGETR